jgi:hypothetical protein
LEELKIDILLLIVVILVILWFTGWRGNWGKGRISDQRLIHILLILAVIILAVWLLKAVLHLF